MDVEKIIKTEKKLPLEKRVLLHLQMTSSAVTQKTSMLLKPFDISLQQFNVLRILRGQTKNIMNQREIQDRMVHKMSNTTRLVNKLYDKNLVEREICKKNRRKVEIKITPAGKKMLEKIDPLMLNTEQELVAGFSKQEIQLLDNLLDKLNTENESA